MAGDAKHLLSNYLHQLSASARMEQLPDRTLIERFVSRRDDDAFAVLVRRHGPMVLRVCQCVLCDSHDAEDVFQAVFLVLSRKAASLRRLDSVGCFLHGVAYRLAQKARAQILRQRQHEGRLGSEPFPNDPLAEVTVREARTILDEELSRLPEKYRAVLVSCCLEGKTRDEAAQQLGWSTNLVKSRLEQGRRRLRERLIRRGLTLPAALASVLLIEESAAAAVPAPLIRATVQAAQSGPTNRVSASIAQLAESTLKSTVIGKAKVALGVVVLASALTAGASAFLPSRERERADAQPLAHARGSDARGSARSDRFGDLLPEGALARFGTQRWRHGDQVMSVAFSPDGKILAGGSWEGGAVHLWDAKTGKLLHILRGHESWTNGVFFTPDGKELVSCGGLYASLTARVWDVSTGKELRLWPIHGGRKYALSPDGKLLAGSGTPRRNRDTIALWDIATGKVVRELPFEGVQDSVNALAFAPDGKRLVSGGQSTLRLFDVVEGKQIRAFGTGGRTSSVAFSSDGKTVAVSRGEEPVTLWDITTFKKRPLGVVKTGSRLAFSHDGKTLAECRYGKAVLWDVATGKKLRELPGMIAQVWDASFSPDDKTLAVGNYDSQVRLWDISTGIELSATSEHRQGLHFLAFVDRDHGIASACDEGVVCHWDIATSKLVRKFQDEKTQCYCGDLSPDGRTLALGDGAGVHLIEWPTGKPVRLLKGHKLQVWSAVFSPKGDVLASSANMDQHILLWDVAAGKELRRILTPYLHDLRSLAWSPDGKILASAGAIFEQNRRIDTVYLWDTSTGERRRQWALRESKGRQFGALFAVAFSPDGTLLAAADGDNTIAVWDASSGRTRVRLVGHRKAVMALAFSPDGRMLASGGEDRIVRLWELSTGKERRRFEGHLGGIAKLAFSTDGLTVASASGDTSVLLWSVMDRDPRHRQPNLVLDPKQMANLWDDLAAAEAARAWRTVCTLVKAPKQVIPWLKEHLKPRSAAEHARIAQLIAELDSEQFAVRQRAERELAKLGEQAQPALRNALEKKPSLEIRRRVEHLLEKLEGPIRDAGTMRELRSLEVLEYLDTAAARTLLRSLAAGPAHTRLTRQAKAALHRLAHRAEPRP